MTPQGAGAAANQDGAPIPRQVAAQATRWWIALYAGEPDNACRRAWQSWRNADPIHEIAWQRIESMCAQLDGIPAPVARAALHTPSAARRGALGLLALIATGGAGAWLMRDAPSWPRPGTRYATARAERREIMLPDDTHVVLNALTTLDAAFNEQLRTLHLAEGEVLIETAADPADRPFQVTTPEGRVRALGTRFVVRRDEQGVAVAVQHGAVLLEPRAAPQAAQRLDAGMSGRLTPTAARAVAADASVADGWTRGMLIASHMPLARFLREVGRYRAGRIDCDPSIATLQLSGAYPLDDTDRILAALPQALPVEVRSLTRYWVRVLPRAH